MVRSGDAALLTCNYDLIGSQLYSIKWYLGDEEFYRYIPKEEPPHVTFPVKGMMVDVSNSNRQDVTLLNVTRELSGRYKCEVTEDTSSYHTQIKEAMMEVVDVPDIDPIIMVERQRIPVGETLRANCTSGASRPAPIISWTVNGGSLNDSGTQYKVRSLKIPHDGMQLTKGNLEMKVSNVLFQSGKLRLRCFAEIPLVYKATTELEVSEDAPLIASIRGDASAHSHQASGCGRVGLPESFGATLMVFLVSLVLSRLR
ncbi:uncharacterized protein LOC105704112 isoform X2 [Orussus abietinus]|nr:uncharacterized protein LOC105704112 isoform X2 [Orussus abietinus]